MKKSAMIRARMEPRVKAEAEAVLDTIGLSPAEAIRLFYRQVTLHRGLPFPVRIPNVRTRKAMQDARTGRNLTEWPNLKALKTARR